MEFGDFEISEWCIMIICFVALMITLTICGSNETIEREKTKQLQIQQNIIIEERGNNNGTNN